MTSTAASAGGFQRVSGWLKKRGGGTSRTGRRGWKKRWFQLDLMNNVLMYYVAPGGELKGGVRLASASITETFTFGEFDLTPVSGVGR